MIIKPLGKRILIKQTEQEEVKVGDKVIFEKYSGTEVKDGEETYLILEKDNVLAIVE